MFHINPPIMEGLIFQYISALHLKCAGASCWLLTDLLIKQDSHSASNRRNCPSPPLVQLHAQDCPELVAPLCYSHEFTTAKSEGTGQPPPTPCCKLVYTRGAIKPPVSFHCRPVPLAQLAGKELGQDRATCAERRRLFRALRQQ